LRHLRALGIRVATDSAVQRVEADSVVDTDGAAFPAAITLWAAGVQAPALCATLGLPVNRLGQIEVTPTLQSPLDAGIYAIGDCASVTGSVGGAVPPRAQAAHQQAMYLAEVLTCGWSGKAPAFAYCDYGSLVSLGPMSAVGMLGSGKLQVGGMLARTLYALLYRKHLMALHGFARMAARTLVDWIQSKISPTVRLH
jgi:NADH dehydrogenase